MLDGAQGKQNQDPVNNGRNFEFNEWGHRLHLSAWTAWNAASQAWRPDTLSQHSSGKANNDPKIVENGISRRILLTGLRDRLSHHPTSPRTKDNSQAIRKDKRLRLNATKSTKNTRVRRSNWRNQSNFARPARSMCQPPAPSCVFIV